jgi:hypothetical protein
LLDASTAEGLERLDEKNAVIEAAPNDTSTTGRSETS